MRASGAGFGIWDLGFVKIKTGRTRCEASRACAKPALANPESRISNPVNHHRTFNVARPISTSTTEMIQKRTITRGSGQPFSSKW